jgi:hypothetical protein
MTNSLHQPAEAVDFGSGLMTARAPTRDGPRDVDNVRDHVETSRGNSPESDHDQRLPREAEHEQRSARPFESRP